MKKCGRRDSATVHASWEVLPHAVGATGPALAPHTAVAATQCGRRAAPRVQPLSRDSRTGPRSRERHAGPAPAALSLGQGRTRPRCAYHDERWK